MAEREYFWFANLGNDLVSRAGAKRTGERFQEKENMI
jgi:hypothetical protein